ncbi:MULTISPECIES: HYD1 signature containing ADP-ribosyltransferase family protein [Streptomyces]|uniref:HYD1 signature containing ADP-ribosyltransferase family protein n=1 Tax=Streptomyces TaxID=1883 RepID=UPI00131C4462|nr:MULTISPECIES: HYD1 signature containing ADP-ribosyltransferase family protein [Streptomyces]
MVDLNPLHYVNKFNHMFGDTLASGLEFLGITDPAVDPDGVREIAKKWRHLATGLDDAAEGARKALADVEWEGKAAKAYNKRAKAARKSATEMAHSLREGAKALDDFADKAHELLSEIGVLLAEIVEFEIAGLALDVLTLGASSVASTLMAGERALKVVALIARIEREGTALASVIRGVMEVIRGVERTLKTLKEIRGVASVAKMAKEGMKFSAFATLLEDPGAFKDPDKLAGILAEGALLGVGFGLLGKALGKGLKALKPAELAKLSKAFKLNCATFERLKLNPGYNKLPASIRNMIKKFVRDPIDVATGDMALPRVDVELPGVLPLVLERTHISSYRFGGWFGPTWTSTLDQRVQADEDGFVYAAADGARLCFPVPDPETNEPVRPETPGSRLLLSWDTEVDGAVRVTDPGTGLIHVFHSPVAAADDEAVDLPLQHIQDRNGNRITVLYAEGDIPSAVVHSGGYRIEIDRHNVLSRITGLRLLDPAAPGRPGTTLLTFGYDEQGHLTEEINSSGLPMRYTYDAEGRITSWTDRNNTTYWYTYDEHGRVIATGGTGNALASTLAYDDATRTTRVSDSVGHTRVYEHNEALRLIRETDPLGNVTRQEWDEELRLVAVTDPLGQTTRYTYDEHGRITRVTRPDGARFCCEYNALGLPTLVREADGSRWIHQYDDSGNPVAVTDPADRTTLFTYDGSGGLTRITDALGHCTEIRNNKAGLSVKVTNPLGAVNTYERDVFGRPVVLTDPMGARTRLEWTVEGKPTRRIAADGAKESWLYDGEGNCTQHTDANGGVSRFEYTHFDLIAARIGPDGVRHEFIYDTELRLTRVTNPQGLSWDYVYDPAGRLTCESDFDNRVLTYTHDPAGRLRTRTDALGEVIRFEHDPLGRIIRKDVDGAVTTYAYDLSGQLLRAVGPDADLTLERDAVGQVLSETVNGRNVLYRYDALGRRTHRTTPTGATSRWDYDAGGRRIGLVTAGHTLRFAYDPDGSEVTRHLDGAMSLTNTYDGMGRLASRSVVDGTGRIVQAHAYAYRADGNLIRHDDRLNGTRAFELDAAGRVTAVRGQDWTERYAYDEAGNQTEAAWPTAHPGQEATGSRVYAGTRITRAGNVRYEHDARGRVVLRQKRRQSRKPDTWRYTWDAEDRLVSVVTPDGSLWRYLYDPLGRRTAKQRLAADTETVVEQVDFTWDGTTLCEQSTVSAAQPDPVVLTWHHQGLQPVAQAERITAADAPQEEIDARFFAIVTDLVGTPTELVDEHGDIAWRTRSTLWGSTAWASDSTAYTPLRFPGQYFDPESGLHYNHFRHYDPETARYLSPDPLGLAPAPNPNTYVDNPHAATDPLGLAPNACTYEVEQVPEGEITSLFHYTNEKGYKGILESGELRPSLKEHNPKDARFGDGQYLSDIGPGTKTPGQLSFAFLRVPWAGQKFSHYIEVDVRGLQVMRSVERPDVFVIPNQGPLDIAGRIVNHGKS